MIASKLAVHLPHRHRFALGIGNGAAESGFAEKRPFIHVDGKVNPVAHMVVAMINIAIGNAGSDGSSHNRFAPNRLTGCAEKVAIHAQEILCSRA